jgi:hypothetical protein
MASTSEPLAATPARPLAVRGAARWLAPSFLDLVFLSILGWVFVAGSGGWTSLLVDGDAGWHIRTGDWVLEHGRVPQTDIYSFSKPGEPWFAWEWLSGVQMALLTKWAGLKGVALWGGVTFAAFGALLFRMAVWRGANLFVALPLTLLGLGASTIHLLARPHLWTMLLSAVAAWVMLADLARPRRRLWLLVPLAALWTNLHGGFLVLPVSAGILAAGVALEDLPARAGWLRARRYGLLSAATMAVSLLNPYGYRLHLHVADYLRSDWIRQVVQEFQSPSFRSENMLQFEILLVLGCGAAGVGMLRRQFALPLVALFWLHSSLGSVRHVPIFVVFAIPLLATELAALWQRWTAPAARASVARILDSIARDSQPALTRLSAWVAVPVLLLALSGQSMAWPKDFPDVRFPVKLVDRFEAQLAGARVLSSDQWSDYLIYRFYPRQRVFFDGRSDFYGPDLGQRYLRLANGQHDWRATLDAYRFDYVLAPAGWGLCSLLKQAPDWALLADDGKALLFQRRTGPPGQGLMKPSGTSE